MNETDAESFETFVKYLYTGSLDEPKLSDKQTLERLKKIASKYEVSRQADRMFPASTAKCQNATLFVSVWTFEDFDRLETCFTLSLQLRNSCVCLIAIKGSWLYNLETAFVLPYFRHQFLANFFLSIN